MKTILNLNNAGFEYHQTVNLFPQTVLDWLDHVERNPHEPYNLPVDLVPNSVYFRSTPLGTYHNDFCKLCIQFFIQQMINTHSLPLNKILFCRLFDFNSVPGDTFKERLAAFQLLA